MECRKRRYACWMRLLRWEDCSFPGGQCRCIFQAFQTEKKIRQTPVMSLEDHCSPVRVEVGWTNL
eukprot:13702256-Ditylum_brightwellii.AAC.1